MDYFAHAASLFIRNRGESCSKFLANFLNLSVRPFALRVTGGCLIDPEFEPGLVALERALTGGKRRKSKLPRFAGFCLFGGTRMVRKNSPRTVVRGIPEIVPPINRYCPRAQTLGIIAKVSNLKHSRLGIIVSPPQNDADPHVTLVHPDQHSVLIVQPSADQFASWTDEMRECIDIIDQLRSNRWQGLLIAYNGGQVVGQEIELWAKNGDADPFWRVLLVKGSGRITDKYANDEQFLKDHPTVHVCDNNEDSMRSALLQLGAIVYDDDAKRV